MSAKRFADAAATWQRINEDLAASLADARAELATACQQRESLKAELGTVRDTLVKKHAALLERASEASRDRESHWVEMECQRQKQASILNANQSVLDAMRIVIRDLVEGRVAEARKDERSRVALEKGSSQ